MEWQTVLPLVLAVPVSVIPTFLGYARWPYAYEVSLLSCLFLFVGITLAATKANCAARRLLLASIIYLPAVLVLLLLNRA